LRKALLENSQGLAGFLAPQEATGLVPAPAGLAPFCGLKITETPLGPHSGL